MDKVRRLKRVVIKEELVALTGHWLKALILNQFIYWTERSWFIDSYLEEEALRAKAQGDTDDFQVTALPPTEGWVYKTAEELRGELMGAASRHTVRKHCAELVEAGLLMERSNPQYSWDRTRQYRVNQLVLAQELANIGYALDGFSVVTPERTNLSTRSVESVRSIGQKQPSNTKRIKSRDNCPSPIGKGQRAGKEGRAGQRQAGVDSKHPAIMTWRSVTGRYPNKRQYAYVASKLGEEPSLNVLEYVTQLWEASDYNPMNVAGQCDWYALAFASGDPMHWRPGNGRSSVFNADVESSWSLVGRAVEEHGMKWLPMFDDRRIQDAVETVGWAAICQLPDEDGKKRFAEAYGTAGPTASSSVTSEAVNGVLGAFNG